MSRILMLGAGECQLNLIGRMLEEGHEVHVADNRLDSPGKRMGAVAHLVSTFDQEGCLELARALGIDQVLTAGTDQPVRTVGYIQQEMGLPGFLDYEQSLQVTNKRMMKRHFDLHGIPNVAYQLVDRSLRPEDVTVGYPAVLKPVDSQGQRGIFLVEDAQALLERLPETFRYTSQPQVLLEAYYPSDEITVTGWVEKGVSRILSITDRETFQSGDHIGICNGHRYPSRHYEAYRDRIVEMTERITAIFGIKEGPIYYQMLLGEQGIKVNEIAARLGGAYEDRYIPLATGVDLAGLLISRSLGNPGGAALPETHVIEIHKHVYVALLFTGSGRIAHLPPMASLASLPGFAEGKWFVEAGDVLPPVANATQRIGYAIITGESREELDGNLERFMREARVEVK